MRISKATFLAAWVAAGLISLPAHANFDGTAPGSEPVLELGKVEVSGQRQVVKALQAIKVALKRPESSDPKLRDVVVCRIDNDIGTHHEEQLVCATNATLGARREATQNSILMACEGVSGTSCSAQQAFGDRSPLGNAIDANADHVLRMPVNGAALKSLLSKIPDAVTEGAASDSSATAPATASPMPAPSAATSSGH
jgi:hypothetical protein